MCWVMAPIHPTRSRTMATTPWWACWPRSACSIACAPSPLGLPAEVLDGCGMCCASQRQASPHGGGIVISPRACHESPPGMGGPSLGERILPAPRPPGIFGQHEAHARHQLSGSLAAREGAEFGQGGDRHGAWPPPQRAWRAATTGCHRHEVTCTWRSCSRRGRRSVWSLTARNGTGDNVAPYREYMAWVPRFMPHFRNRLL